MIYTDFDIKLSFVRCKDSKEIKEEVFRDFENFVGTQAQINAERTRLEDVVAERVREARRQYTTATNAVYAEFRQTLISMYAPNEAVGNVAWTHARRDTNSFERIEVKFEELVDFYIDVVREQDNG